MRPARSVIFACAVQSPRSHQFSFFARHRTYVWGSSNRGALTIDPSTASAVYERPVLSQYSISSIQGGLDFGCGMMDEKLVCFGENIWGQTGRGLFDGARPHPEPVLVSRPVVGFGVGSQHACAVLSIVNAGDATLQCWGQNAIGQLGIGNNTIQSKPVNVQHSDTDHYVQVSGGGFHTCGVTDDGRALCWGNNEHGQMGTQGAWNANYPWTVPDPFDQPAHWTIIHAMQSNTCGYTASWDVYCWGLGTNGINATKEMKYDQFFAGYSLGHIGNVVGFSGKGDTAYMWTSDGHYAAWGDNTYGQLNSDSFGGKRNWIELASAPNLFAVAGGQTSACMLTKTDDDNTVVLDCFGRNNVGQLGVGYVNELNHAVRVPPPNGLKWESIAFGDSAAYGTAVSVASK